LITTSAPSAAKRFAIADPIPQAAPVITATLLLNCFEIIISLELNSQDRLFSFLQQDRADIPTVPMRAGSEVATFLPLLSPYSNHHEKEHETTEKKSTAI
jgi:hypothetical protein